MPPQLFRRGNLNASEANVEKTFRYVRYMFETAGCEIRDRQFIEVGSGRFARLALRLLGAAQRG